MDRYAHLPVAFYFEVTISGIGTIPFKEVTGLNSEMEVETIIQGGDNLGEYKLPKRIKNSNLVMKRALILYDSSFIAWIKNTFHTNLSEPIVPKDIGITLLGHDKIPVYGWICQRAYPVKWEVEPLDSEKNSILIDSVEFAYYNLTRYNLKTF